MAKYKSFLHVERLNKPDVVGILEGICYITPKLDGTNAVIWFDDDTNEVRAGSRKRKLTLEKDNAGFYNWLLFSNTNETNQLIQCATTNPHLIFYGEFKAGVVGAIKYYEDFIKESLWLFDVYDEEKDRYLRYEEIQEILSPYPDINFVPLLEHIDHPTEEQLFKIAQENKFGIEHSNLAGEGIVIRNYDFKNVYGRYEIAKLVLDEYSTMKKETNPKPQSIEAAIVENYVTTSELSKAKAKTILALNPEGEFDLKSGKMIGLYLNLVFNEAILEETKNWTKKFKDPTVNFKLLKHLTANKAKKFIGLI